MAIDLKRRDDRVKKWGKDIVLQIQAKGNLLQITHRDDSPSKGASLPKLKDKYRVRNGCIDQVGIKFPRSLIWPTKGAGKGMGGSKGSKWTDKYGTEKTTNKKSLGKMGSGNRQHKDFFNATLDAPSGVEELATIVAEETGDAIVNKMFIK